MSTTNSNGYVLIFVGKEHHLADIRGYAYEHRLVMEAKVGRKLKKGEVVHHKDGNKSNNKPENLELKESVAQHLFEHRKATSNRKKPGEKNIIIKCACGCGGSFYKYDESGRPRTYVSGHNYKPYPETQEEILELLSSGIETIGGIAEMSGKSTAAIKICLSRMVKTNKIKRISNGVYSL